MIAEVLAKLSADHRRRLEWFEENAGEVLSRPNPLDGQLPLAHPRMGIYKPAGMEYSLSIIVMLASPYEGDRVTRQADGSWNVVYHEQSQRADNADELYANAGLRACLRDQIPVGVLQEVQLPDRGRLFEVVGLATPVEWQSGYFILQSLNRPQGPHGDNAVELLLATAEALERQEDTRPLPASDYDARLRTVRQIVARRGQGVFRTELLDAYSGRCAVTECEVEYVLEAAHLRPYR